MDRNVVASAPWITALRLAMKSDFYPAQFRVTMTRFTAETFPEVSTARM